MYIGHFIAKQDAINFAEAYIAKHGGRYSLHVAYSGARGFHFYEINWFA